VAPHSLPTRAIEWLLDRADGTAARLWSTGWGSSSRGEPALERRDRGADDQGRTATYAGLRVVSARARISFIDARIDAGMVTFSDSGVPPCSHSREAVFA
jgi:hypothetical protein